MLESVVFLGLVARIAALFFRRRDLHAFGGWEPMFARCAATRRGPSHGPCPPSRRTWPLFKGRVVALNGELREDKVLGSRKLGDSNLGTQDEFYYPV